MIRSHVIKLAGLASLMIGARHANAAVDSVQVVVSKANAVNPTSASLSAFAYNPLDDSIYIVSFNANGDVRRINNVGGEQTVNILVTRTETELYLRDNDGNRPARSPIQNAIMLNPMTLGEGSSAIGPYSMAVINEAATTQTPIVEGGEDPVDDFAATKRFYNYNLQSGAGGNQVYSNPVTLLEMQTAANTTEKTLNVARQGAWAGDGQSIYVMATGAKQGLWKIDPVAGTPQLLLETDDDTNSEVAVTTAGGVDSIYLRGSEGNDNVGGIDKFTYDGTTLGARSVVLEASQLREFLEVSPSHNIGIASIASDPEGNLYFSNTQSGAPERRGIYKFDAEGRLLKIASYRERDIAVTSDGLGGAMPNSNGLRLNARTYNHPSAGPITQILYVESSTTSVIAGANVFEVGDFNRDGNVTASDHALFGSWLKTRGTALTLEDDYKFDLNGNYVVDWKDVKVLQEFNGFATGDVNFDSVLDLVDLDILGANYYTTASPLNKVWTTGDLGSVDPLYAATAVDANKVDAVDVNLFADAWFDLEQPIAEADLTSRGYMGQFLDDVLAAFGFNSSLAGDFDADGDVDGADFLDWQRQLGSTIPNGTGADANGDGLVDGLDLADWSDNFGQTASNPGVAPLAASVPEPAAAALAALALALVAFTRRHTS